MRGGSAHNPAVTPNPASVDTFCECPRQSVCPHAAAVLYTASSQGHDASPDFKLTPHPDRALHDNLSPAERERCLADEAKWREWQRWAGGLEQQQRRVPYAVAE